ncbi:hypothetical protein JW935_14585 [candidate division KSB1 bacterium]|nr:hypothetical protein [candidate division KSB1 bacterium]
MTEDRRYFKIGGITIKVDAEIPLSGATFSPNIAVFETGSPDKEMIHIRHHFGLPNLNDDQLGQKVFERQDLSIYRNVDGWIFSCSILDKNSIPLRQTAFVDPTYSRIDVYNERDDNFKNGDIPLLSFHQTDQLFITRVLAERCGCMFHASGVDLDGAGFLFVGHSEAGKSTMIKMLNGKVKILCDDRIIVRKAQDEFRIYGTWHHGEIPVVSPHSAPLKAILLLEKSSHNRILPFTNTTELIGRLSACTIRAIKPLGTSDWWAKTLAVLDDLVSNVPCRILEFDKSGEVVDLLRGFES